ncbi:MAG: DUF2508 family protein [Desulfitobacteriaceae bacterium]|nr:DUF2508 family protein [Desulfitobacteriaceae bacterium]MDD4753668.1 DUF2508 family protein [Desulfitobacteriaceae bacterium]
MWRKFFKEMGKAITENFIRIDMGNTPEREYVLLVEKARQDWLWSKRMVEDAIEPNLIDRAIYYQQSAERRYVHLLKKAAEEKIRADDDIVIYFVLAARNHDKGRVLG